jgi:hypothetical protein
MELTNDQVALLAGFGAIAASILLMTLSYYLGRAARARQAQTNERRIGIAQGTSTSRPRRSRAA